jgi:nucleoside-diphosphate-sugar epimerase
VLVLGAGGFIGRRIVDELRAAELDVVAHVGPAGSERPAELDGCEVFFASLEDGENLTQRMRGVDAVVHVAGPPSVAASFENPAVYAGAHVLGTARVLEASRTGGLKRLVYVSSAEVYGRPLQNPVAESEPVRPLSPYAGMKVAAETIVRACGQSAGIELAILRPFSVYGPGMSEYSLVGSLVAQTLAGGAVAISSPEVVRDYVFVDDVARAVVASLARRSSKDALVANIGSGRGTSALELAYAIQSIVGVKKEVARRTNSDRPIDFDIPHLIADIGLAKRQLGWEPEVALERGLGLTIRSRSGAPA